MKEEMLRFILENDLSPFASGKTSFPSKDSIYKTRDAKAIHTKVLSKISSKFVFSESANLWNVFGFTGDVSAILRRQEFFKGLNLTNNSFLEELDKPRRNWKPRYDITVVTEDESTFVQLNELGCSVQLLVSEKDVMDLERYDIIQVVDCSDFKILLERLPQTVFIDSIENVYLERYLESLSGWRENFVVLKHADTSEDVKKFVAALEPLFDLLDNKEGKIINEGEVERVLEEINERISEKIKEMTISGEAIMKMLGEGKMPPAILEIVRDAIGVSGLSEHIFNLQIPVTIDYKELEDQIKRQSANEFTDMAERVKRSAEELKRIPKILERLSALLLIEDFCSGVSQIISGKNYPMGSNNLTFIDASNMFLENAQPVSFQLDKINRCSILTGANSGGKTTLLEHILQNISLFQLGMPTSGEVHLPIFSDVYYFAKTKGSASKGAFETLLSQMSKIKPSAARGIPSKQGTNVPSSSGNLTLILADEIEAVTEPGVAGKIISATADYFIKKNCFIVLATHLGYEIQKTLPEGSRIDGIEAKGLDENFNLIVDHNPVLGRLAHSTPELIVERMANADGSDYFLHLHESLKKN
jgi:DNA mismatch repair protein MutS2